MGKIGTNSIGYTFMIGGSGEGIGVWIIGYNFQVGSTHNLIPIGQAEIGVFKIG